VEKPKYKEFELPPLAGTVMINESLAAMPAAPWKDMRGLWAAKDGGLWAIQKPGDEQGANIRVPLSLTDGKIQYEIRFKGANRHSLRVECGDNKQSFRIEVARSYMAITKNPGPGEGPDMTEPLARKVLNLEANQWYPVRITFKGGQATVQVGAVIIKGSHPVIAQPKKAMNMLVFGESAGFRNVMAAK